jgi:hypothetical protein
MDDASLASCHRDRIIFVLRSREPSHAHDPRREIGPARSPIAFEPAGPRLHSCRAVYPIANRWRISPPMGARGQLHDPTPSAAGSGRASPPRSAERRPIPRRKSPADRFIGWRIPASRRRSSWGPEPIGGARYPRLGDGLEVAQRQRALLGSSAKIGSSSCIREVSRNDLGSGTGAAPLCCRAMASMRKLPLVPTLRRAS